MNSAFSAVALVLVALAVGLLVGGLATLFGIRRVRSRTSTNSDGRFVRVSEVKSAVVASSPSAIAVVDRREDVIVANRTAKELGIVHDRLLDQEVWGTVLRVFADGSPRSFSLQPKLESGKRNVIGVAGQIQMLSERDDRFAVIYGVDYSENLRMQAARRDFVANVSHELKTPVGAMSVLLEALIDGRDDPDIVEMFGEKAIIEVKRMNQMISELISLSKLQGAESLPDVSTVEIDDVVAAAVSRCQQAAETAGIALNTDRDTGLTVEGDADLLVTALSNLIINAINYSPSATPVTISRSVTDSSILLRVTDRGIGIAPEDQRRVFERFYRVDQARSRSTGGTGLGLSIVKHIAENHGGSISVWSRKGTGSTFTLEIPLPRENDDTDDEGYDEFIYYEGGKTPKSDH